ncbi:MAG: hypothetical protein M3Y59_01235 [Myxococcota bacterium]|nr:hypothetical protein [Myxococcota bacterium]
MTSPISPYRSNPRVQTQNPSTSARTQAPTTRTSGDQFVSGGSNSAADTARRSAVDAGLSQLRNLTSVSVEGETYDLNELLGDGLAEERKSFEDQINALGNQNPPLSPEEIKSRSASIMNEWQETATMLGMMVESMLMQIFQKSLPKPGFGTISG